MALSHGIEPWVTLVKDEPPLLDDVRFYLCFMLSLPLSTEFVDIVILISHVSLNSLLFFSPVLYSVVVSNIPMYPSSNSDIDKPSARSIASWLFFDQHLYTTSFVVKPTATESRKC